MNSAVASCISGIDTVDDDTDFASNMSAQLADSPEMVVQNVSPSTEGGGGGTTFTRSRISSFRIATVSLPRCSGRAYKSVRAAAAIVSSFCDFVYERVRNAHTNGG